MFDNALSFTPEDGWMKVSLETRDHGAVIALANLGPPLPEGDDLRLTDAFVNRRDPQARGDSPHLGLGLYVAHRVALQHGAAWSPRIGATAAAWWCGCTWRVRQQA